MGGDHAPAAIVDGAVAAAAELDVHLSLVGAPRAIEDALARPAGGSAFGGTRPASVPATIRIVDAPDVIDMSDRVAALRRKTRASIRVAAELVARHEADALVSAGHTGATVVACHAAFGMIAGVDRPALATTIPTRDRQAVLLDAGANVECRPQHLLQFAAMGSVYARIALGVETPRVGLLSVGEEETKGNELTRDAHHLLKASRLNFIGNVEGGDIYSGVADVIVCDGFTGNVVLKTSEGLVEALEARLGDRLSDVFDYAAYGGAPLLGVAGVAIVCHGRSSARAVRNAIGMANRFATSDFIRRVEAEIAATAAPIH